MSVLVYLSEDAVLALLSGSRGDAAERVGVAFGHDDGTVFQAWPAPPAGRTSGTPTACLFGAVPSPDELPATRARAAAFFGDPHAEGAPWAWRKGFAVFVAETPQGRLHAAAWRASADGPTPADVRFFLPGADLGARSRGLLETELLADRRVAVVGLGSGGSAIAVELAKAGVGRFDLFDFDRLEPANVARHACGVSDLGRFKVHAVRDAILDHHPRAEVRCHVADVTSDPAAFVRALEGAHLLVAATDNDRSRFVLNDAALALRVPALFGRAITRAAGGDVLRVRPGAGPCLACVFDAGMLRAEDDERSSFRQARAATPAYVSDRDVAAVVQPGLSSDIAPINNLMVKLALLELTRGRPSGLASLDADLQADLYVWANRRERTYAGWEPMGFAFGRPSVLRWYGARVERSAACPACAARGETADVDPLFAS